jgi:hypothetical protein
MIKRYLENGECLDGFKVLLHRVRKTPVKKAVVLEDLSLIEQLLKKAGEKPT